MLEKFLTQIPYWQQKILFQLAQSDTEGRKVALNDPEMKEKLNDIIFNPIQARSRKEKPSLCSYNPSSLTCDSSVNSQSDKL